MLCYENILFKLIHVKYMYLNSFPNTGIRHVALVSMESHQLFFQLGRLSSVVSRLSILLSSSWKGLFDAKHCLMAVLNQGLG